MHFTGLNRKQDDAELEAGESPDTVNAFLGEHKYGLLGARKGKRYFNTAAYAGDVVGMIGYKIPGFTKKLILALDDGSLRPVDAPSADPNTSAPTNVRVVQIDELDEVLITYPATEAEEYGGTSDNIIVAAGDIMLFPRPNYGTSGWAESGGTSTVTLTLSAVIQATSGIQDTGLGTITLVRSNLGSTAGQAAGTPTAAPGSYGRGYFPITLTVSGVLGVVGVAVDATYENTGAGTFGVSLSASHFILIRGQVT